jgi:molecular chaperone DnaK (HSP70)
MATALGLDFGTTNTVLARLCAGNGDHVCQLPVAGRAERCDAHGVVLRQGSTARCQRSSG